MKIIKKKESKFNNKKTQPLHIAAYHNSLEMGKLLLSNGADINGTEC